MSTPMQSQDPELLIQNPESRIGIRLKHARLTRGLTLASLAEEVGCSVSALSKIENSRANPSIALLHRICRSLSTNIATLFATASDEDSPITRAAERAVLITDQIRSGHGIQLEQLIPAAAGSLLQGYVHLIEPGGYSDAILQHEGEEAGYVIEGMLELHLNGKSYIAHAGDSFFFQSNLPHSYGNPGDVLTKVVWLNTPPTF